MITGWIPDPVATSQLCEDLARHGHEPLFGAAYPKLNGFWGDLVHRGCTGVFLWEWEQDLLGHRTTTDYQLAGKDPGTCVSRGTHRAVQDSLGNAIRRGRIVGKPCEIAYEPIYGGGRVRIGRGQLGSGGGMVGAWAARYVREVGVVERGHYGPLDLTSSREDLATEWGMPGRGTPQEIESVSHPVKAIHLAMTVDNLMDCTAAQFGSAQCSTWLFGARDRNGMSRYAGPTAHCEAVRGVFVRQDGGFGFVRQQSWGENQPQGPQTLRYAGGEIQLPPGCYGVTVEDMQQVMQTGETWVIGYPETIRPAKASDFVKGTSV